MGETTTLVNDFSYLVPSESLSTSSSAPDKSWMGSWSQEIFDQGQYELFQDQLSSVHVNAHSADDYDEALSRSDSPSDPLTPPAFPSPPTPAPSSQRSPSSSPGSSLSSELPDCLPQLEPLPLSFMRGSPPAEDATKCSNSAVKQPGSYARFRVNTPAKRPRNTRQQAGAAVQPELRALQPPPSDGYKWRKYGRKFNKGICRSYYRCINSECPAKVSLVCCYLSSYIVFSTETVLLSSTPRTSSSFLYWSTYSRNGIRG